MTTLLLWEVAAKGGVILVAAAMLAALVRTRSAAVRHLVWATAVWGLVLLPLPVLLVPAWRVAVLPAPAEPAVEQPLRTDREEPGALVSSTLPRQSGEQQTGAPETPVAPQGPLGGSRAPASHSRDVPWPTILAVTWITGTIALIARIVFSWRAAARLVSRARPVREEPWATRLERAMADIPPRRSVALVMSGDVSVPMTCGILRPVIVLPDSARSWSEDRARIVLLHELSHVRRADCLTHVVALGARALHWFNPLAWSAVRRLRSEREHACDDAVLASGLPGTDYADHLLGIAREWRDTPAAAAALAMARPRELEDRLMSILDTKSQRGAEVTRARQWFAGVALAAVVPLGAMQLEQSGPITPAADAAVTVGQTPPETPRPSPQPSQSAAPAQRGATPGPAPQPAAVPGGVQGGVGGGVGAGVGGGVGGGVGAGVGDGSKEARRLVLSDATRDSAVQGLTAAMKDEDADVRQQALLALAELKLAAAFDPLVAALGDKDPEVREVALHGLAQLEDARAVPAVTRALKDADADVRGAAAYTLGELGGRAAIPQLVEALKDAEPEVRKHAARALSRMPDERAVSALTALLKDQDAEVRQMAAHAVAEALKEDHHAREEAKERAEQREQ